MVHGIFFFFIKWYMVFRCVVLIYVLLGYLLLLFFFPTFSFFAVGVKMIQDEDEK